MEEFWRFSLAILHANVLVMVTMLVVQGVLAVTEIQIEFRHNRPIKVFLFAANPLVLLLLAMPFGRSCVNNHFFLSVSLSLLRH